MLSGSRSITSSSVMLTRQLDLETGLASPAGHALKRTAQALRLFLVVGFELGGEDACQAADIFRDEEVALHEALDALLAFAVAVPMRAAISGCRSKLSRSRRYR